MQRFKYEDNELIPILQSGDLITVYGSPADIVDSGCARSGCYFKASYCTMECRCPLDGDLIFRKVEKKFKQDVRVELTKSVAKEEGVYFYLL